MTIQEIFTHNTDYSLAADAVSPGLVNAYFQQDYKDARAAFLTAANKAGAVIDTYVNENHSGPDGSVLSTDVAILGRTDADTALLILSGTHGPEGYSGSAAQIALLNQLALNTSSPDIKIVLIHAINPWGFAHGSRTTENNVDLNRNFIDWDQQLPENPLFKELNDLFTISELSKQALDQSEQAISQWIKQHGHDVFVDVRARGQYQFKFGMHYGGTGREWSNHTLEKILQKHLNTVKKIALIDWHTGLGEIGQPFFLCFNEYNSAAWQRACNWWGQDNVDTKAGFGGSARPNYSGLVFYGVQKYAPQAEVTGAVIEFGTQKAPGTRHALQIDQYLKTAKGLNPSDLSILRELVVDAYAPKSLNWRRSVLAHAINIQNQALAGASQWANPKHD